jgi:peptide/nickel transport system ATP-binding protein
VTEPILSVRDLSVGFDSDDGFTSVIERVSFDLRRGETLALVGESGCGKSLTALAILRLLPAFGRITSGSVSLHGQDLAKLSNAQLRSVRGNRISMIFQEPMSALNPVFRVGDQIAEAVSLHVEMTRAEAAARAVDLLASVGIPDAASRAHDYPHQLSGGMRQRVLIAMALACEPDVLIADEPTTALDVTIQAQIMDLMLELQQRLGTAILFISHDLGVVSHMADEIAVMYAGRIVEQSSCAGIVADCEHPYTKGLLATTPRIDQARDRLPAIPGRVPAPAERASGCTYEARCPVSSGRCAAEEPALLQIRDQHLAACFEVPQVE